MSVNHAFKLAVTVESEQQISNPTCVYIQLVCLAQTRIPFKLLQVQGPLQYKLTTKVLEVARRKARAQNCAN